jgi:hypothetical protein
VSPGCQRSWFILRYLTFAATTIRYVKDWSYRSVRKPSTPGRRRDDDSAQRTRVGEDQPLPPVKARWGQMLIPRRIFVLWLQGEEKAPPLVQMCLLRWRKLNPTYELKVLNFADAEEILKDFPLDCRKMRPQALSDVLRMKLLADQGGVWVDATVFPVRPLDSWLPEAASSGFFAFEGHLAPLDVDSWFLAASPCHIIPRLWWQEIERYWYKPRRLIRFIGDWGSNYNFDPLSFFRSDEARGSAEYPYYWFMYIFTHLLNTSAEFRSAWEGVQKRSGLDCHAVQSKSNEGPGVSDRELVEASLKAYVQKLSNKNHQMDRWLALDKNLEEVDRAWSVDLGSYGVYERPEGMHSWYQRANSLARKRLQTLGGQVLRHLPTP